MSYASRNRPHLDLKQGIVSPTSLRILQLPSVDSNLGDAAITDVQYIGSYNWNEKSRTPTMLVPGCTRVLTDVQLPVVLQPDSGSMSCDYNGQMSSSFPMLPTILAVETVTPDFDWSSVDVLTDRNGLRKLMQWVNGTKPDFRLDFSLLGNRTMSFQRFEPRTRMSISGYGFSFEDAVTCTQTGFEESGHHHRIICYNFGGLKVVVRFEADACLPPADADPMHEITAAMSGHIVDERPHKVVKIATQPSITVLKRGFLIEQDRILELTTSSKHLGGKYMQMYLSQTPNMILGCVQDGVLTSTAQRASPATNTYVQAQLNLLRSVLGMLQDMVIAAGAEGRISVLWQDKHLTLENRQCQSVLPEEYARKFR